MFESAQSGKKYRHSRSRSVEVQAKVVLSNNGLALSRLCGSTLIQPKGEPLPRQVLAWALTARPK